MDYEMQGFYEIENNGVFISHFTQLVQTETTSINAQQVKYKSV